MAEKRIQKSSFRSNRLKLIEEAAKRGDKIYNIWNAYSTKIKKNCVLIGDAEYLNFQWMEGDPNITAFSIDSDLYLADGDDSNGATYPDAIVTMRSGGTEWREVKNVEDEAGSERDIRQKSIQSRITADLGYSYLRVTPGLLKKHEQFISNWRRATAFCSACRHLSIQRYEDEVLVLVNTRKSIVLEEVTALYEYAQHPLVVAAVLKCAQVGSISTDLAKAPLGPRTILAVE